MRIALLSDVHANLHALQAVLDDAETQGVERVYSLGDVVGYNAFPSECARLVRERTHGAIMGNHDWAATVGAPEGFNPVAKTAIDFTRRQLSGEDSKYLSSLDPSAKLPYQPVSIDLYHASPYDPLWEYVFPATAHAMFRRLADALPADRARVVVLGHTHVPMMLSSHALDAAKIGDLHPLLVEDKLDPQRAHPFTLLNPGSVGQPRDGDPRASYAIVDTQTGVARFRRVEYDVAAAQRAVREAGLPEILADRLALGR